MKKILIIIFILMSLFVGSCQNAHQSSQKKIDTSISKKIDSGLMELPELLVQQKMNWMVTPLVVGLFSGIVLTFSGARVIGLGIITASIACLILIITMSLYMKWVALGGIIVLLVGLFFLFREIYNKNIFQKEAIATTEIAKNLMDDDKKEKLKETLTKIQSKSTKEIVSKIKRD